MHFLGKSGKKNSNYLPYLLILSTVLSILVTPNALSKTAADDILFLIFLLFIRENMSTFHVNPLLAGDSHEMPRLIFSEKNVTKIKKTLDCHLVQFCLLL